MMIVTDRSRHAPRAPAYDLVEAFDRLQPWRRFAACRTADPSIFYADTYDRETMSEARAICASCRVRDACLEYALDNGEDFGVWGGLTGRERRRLAS